MISFCFAGFDRHLPGFDRYSVLGDDSEGSFNLKVVSAVKDDEAKYECQVGPGKGNPPIRASAFLTVNCKPSLYFLIKTRFLRPSEVKRN